MLLPHQSHTSKKSYRLAGHKALIITTSQTTLDVIDDKTGSVLKKGKPTGVYAAEMTEPYYTFLEAQMEVDVASISGGEIPIEPLSLKPLVRTTYDVRFQKDSVLKEKVHHSIPLKDIDISAYDIIFLSGGWGAAYDFAQSSTLAQKISEAYAAQKILCAVCHGSLGFIGAKKPNGSSLVEGVEVTGVTNKQIRQLGISHTPKHPESSLRESGAIYSCNSGMIDMFKNHVVVDQTHRIVSGQNQKAGVEVAQKAMEMLTAKKKIKTSVILRNASMEDLIHLQTLFTETIQSVCRKDYSPEQIEAWSASVENTNRWHDLLQDQYVLVAEKNNTLVGFASLRDKDYLDFFYVHKDYQGQGVAKQLYEAIEKEANERNAKSISSDVSITAKPFFESRGFTTLREQKNKVRGVELINYKMEKVLSAETNPQNY